MTATPPSFHMHFNVSSISSTGKNSIFSSFSHWLFTTCYLAAPSCHTYQHLLPGTVVLQVAYFPNTEMHISTWPSILLFKADLDELTGFHLSEPARAVCGLPQNTGSVFTCSISITSTLMMLSHKHLKCGGPSSRLVPKQFHVLVFASLGITPLCS